MNSTTHTHRSKRLFVVEKTVFNTRLLIYKKIKYTFKAKTPPSSIQHNFLTLNWINCIHQTNSKFKIDIIVWIFISFLRIREEEREREMERESERFTLESDR